MACTLFSDKVPFAAAPVYSHCFMKVTRLYLSAKCSIIFPSSLYDLSCKFSVLHRYKNSILLYSRIVEWREDNYGELSVNCHQSRHESVYPPLITVMVFLREKILLEECVCFNGAGSR